MISTSEFRAFGSAIRLLLAAGAIWAVATMASRGEARADFSPAASATATSRVARAVVGAPGVTTVIAGTVSWTAGYTHELAGPVILAVGATLTIEPGTRVEARPGAYIDITRDGRLIADGTPLQPIVLTCTSVNTLNPVCPESAGLQLTIPICMLCAKKRQDARREQRYPTPVSRGRRGRIRRTCRPCSTLFLAIVMQFFALP